MTNAPLPRVLVTEPIHAIGVERLAAEAEVIHLPDRPGETIDQHLPTAAGILVRVAKLDAERLRAAEQLRVIGKHGVGLDNVVATPHIAGGSQHALENMARTVADDILRVLRGEPPLNPYRG